MQNEQEIMNAFEELAMDDSITTEELDLAVMKMRDDRIEYELAKKQGTAKHAVYQESLAKLITMLQRANKSKYHVEGLGTASLVTKLKVRTPKDIDAKAKLIGYIREHFGEDGVLSYSNVNYQSLNKLYNDEFERAQNEGRGADFSIPGLEEPDSEVSLSFRK